MEALDHIAVAIEGPAAKERWMRLLGQAPFHEEEVPAQGVRVTFFQLGPTKIELLEPLSPDSPVGRFLAKKGPGLHHIAFFVQDLQEEAQRLQAADFEPLSQEPQPAALGKQAIFFHPRSTGGVLIELVSYLS